MILELLSDDVLGYQITFLPFTDVKQLCETSKRLNNFCLGTSTKQSNIWRSIIYNTFGYLDNYNDILLKLSEQYNCVGPCYNYYVYVNFINYLDKVTQLMIYYKQGDINSFRSGKYTNTERFLTFFMLGDKEGMKKYELYIDEYYRKIFNTLAENKTPSQKGVDFVLGYTSTHGYLEIVKYLVEHGADVNSQAEYALISASIGGNLEVVKYLVEHGSDVRADNDYALKQSSRIGHLEIVKYLVEQGANAQASNDFALRWSSNDGQLEVVKYLVGQGANVRASDDEALRRAREREHLEVVNYLENIYKERGYIHF